MRKRLVFDIETNGLLHQLTRVHLIIIYDLDAEELLVFRENRAEQAVRLLQNADLIIGHNIINFDIPALEKLFPWFAPQGCIRDTLILTRLMYPHIKERDYELHRRGQLPGKLIGAHSLKAWGYRLGEHKAQFGDDDLDSWAEWSPEMEAYARQDVIVTVTLWDWLCDQIERQEYSEAAISFEHRFADLMARQERNGFCFDEDGAKVLYQQLLARRAELIANLQRQFRPWYVPAKWKKGRKAWTADAAETTVPPKTITYADPLKASRVAGAPFTPIKLLEFNPGSRDMVADRLQRLFGWVPKEFTDTGKPRVSEDILRDLVGELDAEEDGIEETEQELYERFVTRIPQAADLAEYFLVQKRIGQLAEGKNGWLKLVREGKIHGSINTLGAVTRRCTHSKPNVSQAPAVRSPYGREMRSLWYTPARWLLFGTDLSGIEIRCFANVLAEFDGGEYANIVINGDVHTANQQAFGVPTRDNAKTTLYALLYGAGDEKLGSIIGKGAAAGRQIKMNFMKAVPAYPKVVKKLQRMADKQGWIPALDGGRLYVRSAHRTLNTCLQSMGSLVAKNWAMQLEENLTDAGLVHGWHGDFAFCAYNHDEIQIAFRAPEVDLRAYVNDTPYSSWTVESTGAKNAEDLEKKVKKHKEQHLQDWFIANSPVAAMLAQEAKHAVKQTEEHFAFQCPLDCEYKVGQHWADCH